MWKNYLIIGLVVFVLLSILVFFKLLAKYRKNNKVNNKPLTIYQIIMLILTAIPAIVALFTLYIDHGGISGIMKSCSNPPKEIVNQAPVAPCDTARNPVDTIGRNGQNGESSTDATKKREKEKASQDSIDYAKRKQKEIDKVMEDIFRDKI